MEAFYYAFGEHDFFIMADLPSNVDAATASLMVHASGAVQGQLTALLTPEEIDQATHLALERNISMPQFHTVDLNNIELHYVEAPGPGPALVILHGATGSHANFLPFLPSLSEQVHVYVLDLRGHSQSGHKSGAYQIADYGRDAAAFIETVVEKPAFVAGHSLGAVIAVWLAAQTPEWIRGIFLEDPPLYIVQFPRVKETGFYGLFVSLCDHLKLHHANDGTLDDLIPFVGQMPVNDEQTMIEATGPEMVQQRAVQLHQMDPTVLDVAIDGLLLGQYEVDELLTQVRCPAHLLAGQMEFGGAMDDQDVQRAIKRMPHCTHTVFPETGHMIHMEYAETYLQALLKFISA